MVYLTGRIERYLWRTRTSPTRFGLEVLGDPRFVFDLRSGRVPTERIEARVRAWLDAREGKTWRG